MSISARIREELDWKIKLRDKATLKRWKNESGASYEMFNYVTDELEYYKSLEVEPATVDGVWQGDGLIQEDICQALLKEVSKLENIPESEQDWHRQVLSIVNPSLYCYVAGVTCETDTPAHPPLKYIGGGKISSDQQDNEEYLNSLNSGEYRGSARYQWLPAEFGVDESGKVSILSYINNLHPGRNAKLYLLIARIFEKVVPLIENTLSDLADPIPRRYSVDVTKEYQTFEEWKAQLRKDMMESKHRAAKRAKVERENPKETEENVDEDDIEHDHVEIYGMSEIELKQRYKDEVYPKDRFSPPIGKFLPPPLKRRIVNLRGRQLQVIVKLANIILTPEKPTYKGGEWHIEGMKNEHIVCSTIYYYKSENITESRLAFRTAVCEPWSQEDDTIKEVFGYDKLSQVLGSVITKSGRLVCFPNMNQHRVEPFELVDKTKPGCRKILAFFLVDPGMYIKSTLYVPPQQLNWKTEFLSAYPPFNALPKHIVDYIVQLSSPSTLQNALSHKEKTQQERKEFVDADNYKFEIPPGLGLGVFC